MSGDCLLDTNIVIAIFKPEQTVLDQLAASRETYLCPPVLGELYFGAAKSRSVDQNISRIDDFLTTVQFIPCDAETARVFGFTRNELARKGRPIPENDLWIAATALQHDLVVVTRDAHFNAIDGLRTESW
jgi:tRNA(fMet)-specific endonuclease VapC